MHEAHTIGKPNALIIGSGSAIGGALAERLEDTHTVSLLGRADTDYSDMSLSRCFDALRALGSFDRILCCVGILHDTTVTPEKNLRQVNAQGLLHYYQVNSVIPMLCMKHFHRLLDKRSASVFACLSAMVGSIGDNKKGGWYGYRSSKAALNMLVKTTAIEVARSNSQARVVAIHPGTTVTPMSEPFTAAVASDKLYTAQQSASRILSVLGNLQDGDSGKFFNWNGELLPW